MERFKSTRDWEWFVREGRALWSSHVFERKGKVVLLGLGLVGNTRRRVGESKARII